MTSDIDTAAIRAFTLANGPRDYDVAFLCDEVDRLRASLEIARSNWGAASRLSAGYLEEADVAECALARCEARAEAAERQVAELAAENTRIAAELSTVLAPDIRRRYETMPKGELESELHHHLLRAEAAEARTAAGLKALTAADGMCANCHHGDLAYAALTGVDAAGGTS
jgi:hypothetical protein